MAVRLKYLGYIECYCDPFHRTKVMWEGPGDVQTIEDEDLGKRLARFHPDIWEVVPDTPEPNVKTQSEEEIEHLDAIVVQSNGRRVRLRNADRKTVVDYARDKIGLAIKDGHTKVEILGMIAEHKKIADRMITTNPPAEDLPPAEDESEPAETPPADDSDTEIHPREKDPAPAETEDAAGGTSADAPAPEGEATAEPEGGSAPGDPEPTQGNEAEGGLAESEQDVSAAPAPSADAQGSEAAGGEGETSASSVAPGVNSPPAAPTDAEKAAKAADKAIDDLSDLDNVF